MRAVILGLVAVGLVLAGCGGWFRQRPVTVEPTRPPTGDAARPTAPEPPRLAGELARVASELSELQNVVAKLIASSRQLEDQLTYLQRRVGEVESQNRSRAPSPPSGFAPPAPTPAPAAPPPRTATATPAEELYRTGADNP